jgi:predicted AlkP superfamily phosphohydrolase/phosphomutase
MNRRDFMKTGLGAASLLAVGTRARLITDAYGGKAAAKKVIVLGFDGMDPRLVTIWMNEGKLPAFKKLAGQGGFKPLGTSIPPQSPVAWSNFITGMDPGGHGIFDFIHRDPKTYFPVFSASETAEATKTFRLGKYILPIKGGTVRNMVQGRAFWQILEDHGIPSTVFKMPANYPPMASKQKSLSGMGTPDLIGSYGTCSYYTTELLDINEDIGGVRTQQVFVVGNRVDAQLIGPKNTFLKDRPDAVIDFTIHVDPRYPVAKIVLQGQEFLLNEHEWSGWKRVRFPLMPTKSVSGICLFHLKQIRPQFKLYVSAINIDPADPALPISTPGSYAEELARKFGPFFTKGLPADTSALENNVLDEADFLRQDDLILAESKTILEYELGRFDSGLLFYYISSTDQRQHMFWRLFDDKHPAYNATLAKTFGNVIEKTYGEADRILDHVLGRVDKDTVVVVMSDHGFNPFYRGFNLNTWLRQNGYLRLRNEFREEDLDLAFAGTDWSRTKAYGLGLNGLYVNRIGREAEGIVGAGAENDDLVLEIARKLEAFKDPKTGENVLLHAYVAKDIYSRAQLGHAPDIVLGFNRGYRISNKSPLGRVPKDVLEVNTLKWSGDHMGAPEVIPGIVLANRPIAAVSPALYDVTATILDIYGIERPREMRGKTIF